MKEIFFAIAFFTVFILFLSCKKETAIIEKKMPAAMAGNDQIITLPVDSIVVDGSASTDPDGQIVSYSWEKISGPNSFQIITPGTAKTLIKKLTSGIYKFKLSVRNTAGLSAIDTIQITVMASLPPVANAGIDQVISLQVNSVTLNGTASIDPDGIIVKYLWIKVTGPNAGYINTPNQSVTTVNFLTEGVYTFRLVVTDNTNASHDDSITITVVPLFSSCDIQLTSFGNLSIARSNVVTAAAGNKILFAGGDLNLQNTSPIGSARVDIYDIVSQTWSTAELSEARSGMSVAVAGNKIFFAGGYNSIGSESTRVDIYDASANTWSRAELSIARESIAATVLGNKIFFAGGWEFYDVFDRIDIYDISTNTWSTNQLPQANSDLSSVAAGNKIFYAPGWLPSNIIQVYDATLNLWSNVIMGESKSSLTSIAADNKIFWAGGQTSTNTFSDNVQIYDINTKISTTHKLSQARSIAGTVIKNNKILFYKGYNQSGRSDKADVYDLNTNTWSAFNICPSVSNSGIISVNNTVYVAGGYINGALTNQVWLLNF